MNIHLEEMQRKPIKYAAKQILYSDRVRKNNYNRIKKHPRKSLLNMNDSETIPVLKNTESLQDLIQVLLNRLFQLQVLHIRTMLILRV